MRFVTVSGPPSSGKTAVILKTVAHVRGDGPQGPGLRVGVVKFDCLSTQDDETYARHGLPVRKGLSGALCPDHYFVSNVEECVQWGRAEGLDVLVSESAGLCNRCSPYIRDVLAVCVIDNLSGIDTPQKIGPMLKSADIVVITKGDVVSQAEREVFAARVRRVNPKARILHVNGVTGQGSFEFSLWRAGAEVDTVEGRPALQHARGPVQLLPQGDAHPRAVPARQRAQDRPRARPAPNLEVDADRQRSAPLSGEGGARWRTPTCCAVRPWAPARTVAIRRALPGRARGVGGARRDAGRLLRRGVARGTAAFRDRDGGLPVASRRRDHGPWAAATSAASPEQCAS
jgi:Ni2+-binding GTPase involved in maturation of urease and hydrogenase